MRFGLLVVLIVLGSVASVVVGQFDSWLGLLVFTVVVVGGVVLRLRAVQQGAHLNNRGLTLLSEGRLTEAIALFGQAQRTMWPNPLPRFNLGSAYVWLWRLDEAELALDAATRTLQGRPLRMIAAPLLMLISALKNEPDRVQARALEVEGLGLDRSAVRAMALGVMAAREGRWADVHRELSLERTRPLGGPARALADALRAWATTQSSGACPPIDAVGVFGETGPAAVARWWPAFAEFLQRHA